MKMTSIESEPRLSKPEILTGWGFVVIDGRIGMMAGYLLYNRIGIAIVVSTV